MRSLFAIVLLLLSGCKRVNALVNIIEISPIYDSIDYGLKVKVIDLFLNEKDAEAINFTGSVSLIATARCIPEIGDFRANTKSTGFADAIKEMPSRKVALKVAPNRYRITMALDANYREWFDHKPFCAFIHTSGEMPFGAKKAHSNMIMFK